MARSKKIAQPQSDTPLTAVLTQSEVLSGFKDKVKDWRNQSLLMTCSAAVCMVVGVHSGKDAVSQDSMIEKLKKEVSSTGLSDSQVSKYIGLARALVNSILHKFKLGGPVHEVLSALTVDEAIGGLLRYLSTQNVGSLEDMTVHLNKYRRTPQKRVTTQPVVQTGLVAAPPLAPVAEPVLPHRTLEEGEQVITGSTAKAQPSFDLEISVLSVEQLIKRAVTSGHSPIELADAAIDLMTTETELSFVRSKLQDRSRQLSTPAIRARAQGRGQVAA